MVSLVFYFKQIMNDNYSRRCQWYDYFGYLIKLSFKVLKSRFFLVKKNYGVVLEWSVFFKN